MEYKAAVLIGRFQPFHKSHLTVLQEGLKIAEKVIILVGSYRSTLTTKNPFTFEQRKVMIESCLDSKEFGRVIIEPLRDYYCQDSHWVASVQNTIEKHTDDGDSIVMLGSYKDESSYYINYFREQWPFKPTKCASMDASTVRDILFTDPTRNWQKYLPTSVADWITKEYLEPILPSWQDRPLDKPRSYRYLHMEYQEILKEHDKWKNAPYGYSDRPTMMTADAVVIQSGHVLCVQRGGKIGYGLYAVPGGYARNDEIIEDSMLRELKEETGIRLDKNILRGSIVDKKVFDYPGRSQLGRVITTAYAIKLQDRKLIEVRGNDDAKDAFWMPLNDAIGQYEDQFFDDHVHIIRWAMGVADKSR